MNAELWERVKAVLDEISDSDPASRPQLLERLDAETRREVERLLATLDPDETLPGSGPGLIPAPHEITALIRDQHSFEPGQTLINRFDILRFLGSGGMGEVYAARDRMLGEVAIKTLRLELASFKPIVESFRAEVSRGRSVKHPNVCGIYDLFDTEYGGTDGVPFFTMELLSGPVLSVAAKERGGFPEPEANRIAVELCAGLQAAHDAGVIHGDFKTGNVILAEQPGGGSRAKITDFGLARRNRILNDADLGQDAGLRGTKPYLSAELLAGGEPQVASDIFALGVALYFLRTARYPFPGDADIEQIRISRRQPPPLETLQSELGENWAQAIAACIDPDPVLRPESAAEVISILSRRKGWNPSRRHILAAAAVTGAVAIAGNALVRYQRGPALPQGRLRTLVEDFNGLDGPPAVSRAVRNLVKLSLASSKRVELVPPAEIHTALVSLGHGNQPVRTTTAKLVAERTRAKLIVRGDVRPEGQGYRISCETADAQTHRVLVPRQSVSSSAFSLPSAITKLTAAIRNRLGEEVRLAQFGNLTLEEADTTHTDSLEAFTLGIEFHFHGEPQAALEKLREATRIDPDFAIAYMSQAAVLITMGEENLAFEPARNAFRLKSKLTSRHQHYASYLYLLLQGDFAGAHEQLRLLTEFFPNDPNYQRQLSHSFSLLGRTALAMDPARRSVELDPDNPMNTNIYVSALAENGRFQDSERLLGKLLKDSPDSILLRFAEAYIRLLQLDTPQAVRILSDSAQKSGPWSYSGVQLMKAEILDGKLLQASKDLESVIAVRGQAGSQNGLDVLRYWLGQVSGLLGDRGSVLREASALCSREAIPSNLAAVRYACELSWLAGERSLLQRSVRILEQMNAKHFSTRSKGFLEGAVSLLHSLREDFDAAVRSAASACSYWPDVVNYWILGEALLRRGEDAEALEAFRAVIQAKVNAIRFQGVVIWVKSHARAAQCLEALGKPSEAQTYWNGFRSRWGDPQQYQSAFGPSGPRA